MLDYIKSNVENLISKYPFDINEFVNVVSSSNTDVHEQNIKTISSLIFDTDRVIIVTNRIFENKILRIAESILDNISDLAILGFSRSEYETAEYYEFYLKSNCDLKNWVGNILSLQIAGNIHHNYLEFLSTN